MDDRGEEYCPEAVLPLTREWIEIYQRATTGKHHIVLPLTREWIEMSSAFSRNPAYCVLPLTREWIEIKDIWASFTDGQFSLSRGSGLKY